MLLPLLFVIVAALFATRGAADGARDGGAAAAPRLHAQPRSAAWPAWSRSRVISWLELPPRGLVRRSRSPPALPLLVTPEPARTRRPEASPRRRGVRAAARARRRRAAGVSLVLVHVMARGALWSPYYKITVGQDGADTVVEVNNIFHQSMAPVDAEGILLPVAVHGVRRHVRERADPRRRLGHRRRRGAAARRRARRRGRDRSGHPPPRRASCHPDHPYDDPRVTVINDDARHFLRTTTKKYDLVVFALIDSLTMQSSFSGVRLESYMFTEESFRAVRDRLTPRRRAGRLQLLPRAVAGRSAGEHRGRGVRRRAARARARGARLSRRA